ncbi:MAG: alpha-mannosidase, partial [Vagococcus sp.]
YTLEDRENGKYNNEFSYELTLIMDQNSDIKGNIHFENTLLNHRVRLKVNLNDQITNSVSGLPFGFISKTNKELNDWQKDYSEMPVNVEPFEKTVSAITESSCVTVFTQDSKEYEYSDDSLFITLLATTDSLGKPNLLYRPGRASGDTTKKGHIMMETPLAQMENNVIDFNFAIDVTEADFSEERVAMWRSKHLQPSVYYQKQDLNYFIYRIDNKIQKGIQ